MKYIKKKKKEAKKTEKYKRSKKLNLIIGKKSKINQQKIERKKQNQKQNKTKYCQENVQSGQTSYMNNFNDGVL